MLLRNIYIPGEWLLDIDRRVLKDRLLGVADAVMPRVKSYFEEPEVPAHVDRFFESCRADNIDAWLQRWHWPNGPAGGHDDLFSAAYHEHGIETFQEECRKRGVRSALWTEFGGANPLASWKANAPPKNMCDEIVSTMDAVRGSFVTGVDLVGPIGSNSSAASVNYFFGRLGEGHIWAAARYANELPAQIPPHHQPKPQMRQIMVSPQPVQVSAKLRTFSAEEAAALCAQDDPAYPLGAMITFLDLAGMLESLKLWPEKFA